MDTESSPSNRQSDDSPAASALVYTFAATRDERIVVLVSVLVGAGVLLISIAQMQTVAAEANLTLSLLLDSSRRLRAFVFLLGLLFVCGAMSAWFYLRLRARTRLELGPELLRYERPGLPLLGLWGASLTVAWASIDHVSVRRVRRGLGVSSELEVGAGRDVIRMNLDRAVGVDGKTLRVEPTAKGFAAHPIVFTICGRSGRATPT